VRITARRGRLAGLLRSNSALPPSCAKSLIWRAGLACLGVSKLEREMMELLSNFGLRTDCRGARLSAARVELNFLSEPRLEEVSNRNGTFAEDSAG
jgi:hypothetical protein